MRLGALWILEAEEQAHHHQDDDQVCSASVAEVAVCVVQGWGGDSSKLCGQCPSAKSRRRQAPVCFAQQLHPLPCHAGWHLPPHSADMIAGLLPAPPSCCSTATPTELPASRRQHCSRADICVPAAVPRLDLSSIPIRSRVHQIPSRASTDPLGEAWASSSATSAEPPEVIGLAALDAPAEPSQQPQPGR